MTPTSVPVAYLDTNIVRDKVESRRVATTLPSLMTTLTRWNQGDVNLVTSKTMKEELERAKDIDPNDIAPYIALYDQLVKVPYVAPSKPGTTSYTHGGSLGFTHSAIQDNPLFEKLRNILGLGRSHWNDADHLFEAISAKSDFFITVDYNSILNHRPEVEAESAAASSPIKLRDPTEFVTEMGW
jgi:hypothetical protein